LLLDALPRHEEQPCVKAPLSEEREDVVFMAVLWEAVDRKGIETLSSMANIRLNILLRENTGKNCSEMPEFCWEE